MPRLIHLGQHLRHSRLLFRPVDLTERVRHTCRHTQDIPVHCRCRQVKANGTDSAGGIIPHAGECPHLFPRAGKLSLILLRQLHRSPPEVRCTAVVAQPLPALVDLLLRRFRQCLYRGKLRQKPLVVAFHRLHTGLLQHDLRQPDPIRLPILPPGQFPCMAGIPRQQRRRNGTQHLFLTPGTAAHPLRQLLINGNHLRFPAQLPQLRHGNPAHRLILVRLHPKLFLFAGDESIGDVIMHMRRHGNAVLPMGFHGQDIHRENLAGLGIGLPDSGLLLCLPHCHRQKVIDAVGVTARPRKGIVDVVVHHQHLGERRIHHETGTGDVPVLALPIQHTAAVLPHGL